MKLRGYLAIAVAIQFGTLFGWTPQTGLGAEKYKVTILHPFSGLSVSYATGSTLTAQAGRALGSATGNVEHAVAWKGTAESLVDLHPAGFDSSSVESAFGESQVGYGLVGDIEYRALLWNSTAESVVDLHPEGYAKSIAAGVYGNQQVGMGYTGHSPTQALLWNGTPTSAVSLHPPGYWMSFAKGVSQDTQVGSALVSQMIGEHAVLWRGTAESYVDLHPAGFLHSSASGVSGEYQVGWATTFGDGSHAIRWKGSATDFVDLHPSGFDATAAVSASGEFQVGYGNVYGEHNTLLYSHALLWNGSAESLVDLHQFLDTSKFPVRISSSSATSINSDGVVVGVAGDEASLRYAVMWTPVPEPSAILLALSSLPLIFSRSLDNRR